MHISLLRVWPIPYSSTGTLEATGRGIEEPLPAAGRGWPQASQLSSDGGFSNVHRLQAHRVSGISPEAWYGLIWLDMAWWWLMYIDVMLKIWGWEWNCENKAFLAQEYHNFWSSWRPWDLCFSLHKRVFHRKWQPTRILWAAAPTGMKPEVHRRFVHVCTASSIGCGW